VSGLTRRNFWTTGFLVGSLGGLIGLRGAEFRLPFLIGLFQFAALEAVSEQLSCRIEI
jgi:hypothetical protein